MKVLFGHVYQTLEKSLSNNKLVLWEALLAEYYYTSSGLLETTHIICVISINSIQRAMFPIKSAFINYTLILDTYTCHLLRTKSRNSLISSFHEQSQNSCLPYNVPEPLFHNFNVTITDTWQTCLAFLDTTQLPSSGGVHGVAPRLCLVAEPRNGVSGKCMI